MIPVLLLRGGGLVKTRRFQEPVYLGDAINAILAAAGSNLLKLLRRVVHALIFALLPWLRVSAEATNAPQTQPAVA